MLDVAERLIFFLSRSRIGSMIQHQIVCECDREPVQAPSSVCLSQASVCGGNITTLGIHNLDQRTAYLLEDDL